MQPGRVELEGLLLGGLPEPQRAGPVGGKAQVVNQLAALALEERRLAQAEHLTVERDRALDVATDQVDVSETDDHHSTSRRGGLRKTRPRGDVGRSGSRRSPGRRANNRSAAV